jgi:pimeloyl-ACP methyl ester carboxylesterase
LSRPALTAHTTASFESTAGAIVVGDLYLAADRSAPALILSNRQGGDRGEWQPLIERLLRAPKRYTILAFDPPAQRQRAARDGAQPDGIVGLLRSDLRAAVSYVQDQTRARSLVLVGSSLGATLAAQIAFDEPKVSALALISPGAALEGADVYRPYSEVRNLPTFIAAADEDTISKEPQSALGKMAMQGTLKAYSGTAHSAAFLGELHPELWQDLESWLMTVYDEGLRERRSLYYADGKNSANTHAGKGVPNRPRLAERLPRSSESGK